MSKAMLAGAIAVNRFISL